MLELIFNPVLCRDSDLNYGKKLAELVDNKLARHYDLDDNSKKKVRAVECLQQPHMTAYLSNMASFFLGKK